MLVVRDQGLTLIIRVMKSRVPNSLTCRKFEHAMLELGSAVNIMPVPIYYEFQFEILYFANILVQLADFFLG